MTNVDVALSGAHLRLAYSDELLLRQKYQSTWAATTQHSIAQKLSSCGGTPAGCVRFARHAK